MRNSDQFPRLRTSANSGSLSPAAALQTVAAQAAQQPQTVKPSDEALLRREATAEQLERWDGMS